MKEAFIRHLLCARHWLSAPVLQALSGQQSRWHHNCVQEAEDGEELMEGMWLIQGLGVRVQGSREGPGVSLKSHESSWKGLINPPGESGPMAGPSP